MENDCEKADEVRVIMAKFHRAGAMGLIERSVSDFETRMIGKGDRVIRVL